MKPTPFIGVGFIIYSLYLFESVEENPVIY